MTFSLCIDGRAISGATGLAVSEDARNLYVANPVQDAVAVFGAAPAITARAVRERRGRAVRVRVLCPAARAAGCDGRLQARVAVRGHRVERSRTYSVGPGARKTLRLGLPAMAQRRIRAGRGVIVRIGARERPAAASSRAERS